MPLTPRYQDTSESRFKRAIEFLHSKKLSDRRSRLIPIDRVDWNWQEQPPSTEKSRVRARPLVKDPAAAVTVTITDEGVSVEYGSHSKPFPREVRIIELSELNQMTSGLELFDLPLAFQDDIPALMTLARAKLGVVIWVPDQVKLDQPIHIVHATAPVTAMITRTLVFLGESSQAVICEEFANSGAGKTAALTQIRLGKSASLTHSRLEAWSLGSEAFLRTELQASDGSTYDGTWFTGGGASVQSIIELTLAGLGATVRLKAACRARADERHELWFHSRHLAQKSTSSVELWSVLGDRASVAFNGNIVIAPNASGTDALQRHKNLLVSKQATVLSVPKLEISNDDVKCAHGASTSSVHPEQVLYFQSRGVSKEVAESLLVDGFTDPVTRGLATDTLRKKAHALSHGDNYDS